MMRSFLSRSVVAGLFLGATLTSRASAFRLAQTIALPNVDGRIDHMAIDAQGGRLFICALGNNSLEIIDLRKKARIHSITGLGTPQGVAYFPNRNRLYVANDKGGMCNIYDGESFSPLGTVDFKDDADNMRYDASTKRIYVGCGKGALGIIDAETNKSAGSIQLSGHPEAFALEKQGPRIFVNVPTSRQVAVVDRNQGKVLATWRVDTALANFPMALDEANHRLFIGCRLPSKLVVLNTDSGAVTATFPISGDADDVFYDEQRHRIYAICGGGSIDVIEQSNPDVYKTIEKIQTAPGARTGFFVPQLNGLFVAVPHRGNQVAEIRQYHVE
jgi:DNA-binding beta-propeller fold protein YncE